MEKIDILKSEYDMARDRYKMISELKYKIVNMLLTILILLLTFIFKGDLPKNTLLLFSIVLYISFIYHSYLNYRGVSSRYLEKLAAMRLKEYFKDDRNNVELFTYYDDYQYLIKGDNKYFNFKRLTEIILIVVLISCLFMTFLLGLNSLEISSSEKAISIVAAIIIISVTGIIGLLKNKSLKLRYEKLKSKIAQPVIPADAETALRP